MASPAMTFNAQAGALASASLGAGANTSFSVDASAKFEVQVQVKNTGGGTVAATNGLQVDVFRRFGAGPTDDTIAVTSFVIPTTVSTTKYQSIALPTGKYTIKLTNLDVTNAITTESTTSTIDSIS
jgi:hypothetical protein